MKRTSITYATDFYPRLEDFPWIDFLQNWKVVHGIISNKQLYRIIWDMFTLKPNAFLSVHFTTIFPSNFHQPEHSRPLENSTQLHRIYNVVVAMSVYNFYVIGAGVTCNKANLWKIKRASSPPSSRQRYRHPNRWWWTTSESLHYFNLTHPFGLRNPSLSSAGWRRHISPMRMRMRMMTTVDDDTHSVDRPSDRHERWSMSFSTVGDDGAERKRRE